MDSCPALVSAAPGFDERCLELEMISADSDAEDQAPPLTPLAIPQDDDGKDGFLNMGTML
jgi:hypothetical protein